MLQGLSFVSKSNGQSEIRLIHDSGNNCIVIQFDISITSRRTVRKGNS